MVKRILFKILPILFLATLFGCGGGDTSKGESGGGGVDGKGGSMSRFSLIGDYLYAISGRELQIFNIAVQGGAPTEPAVPVAEFKVDVGWGIETLYNTDENLFIGAANGVYIFDNKDPRNPKQISKFLHVRSCDPVVVNGKYAYVTLSRGSRCGRGNVSQMDILDLNDITNPILLKSYNMQNPKGLGVGNNLLFVCDDIAGLKVYDVTTPKDPKFLQADTSINCYDLIPYQNRLVISDKSGIVQYNFDEASKSLNKVSEIAIAKQ